VDLMRVVLLAVGVLLTVLVLRVAVAVLRSVRAWVSDNRKFGDVPRTPLIDMIESGNYPYGVGDNPLTDMFRWGKHPFPPDIEEVLRKIDTLGTTGGRVPLGGNWPYSGREWAWASGRDLDGARRDLRYLLAMIEAGRADEVLIDPVTRRPLR
jgi:hypothetical protein